MEKQDLKALADEVVYKLTPMSDHVVEEGRSKTRERQSVERIMFNLGIYEDDFGDVLAPCLVKLHKMISSGKLDMSAGIPWGYLKQMLKWSKINNIRSSSNGKRYMAAANWMKKRGMKTEDLEEDDVTPEAIACNFELQESEKQTARGRSLYDPENDWHVKELNRLIAEAILALPEKHKATMLQQLLNPMSSKALAKQLGKKVNTVKSDIREAYQALASAVLPVEQRGALAGDLREYCKGSLDLSLLRAQPDRMAA